MRDRDSLTNDLDAECRSLTRYLVDKEPTATVLAGYARGHATIPFRSPTQAPGRIDLLLVQGARRHRFVAHAADAYGRHFRPGGPLRQKLVLLLAVLESSPPFHHDLNQGSGVGVARAILGLGWSGTRFVMALATGMLLFGPAHLLSHLGGEGRSGG